MSNDLELLSLPSTSLRKPVTAEAIDRATEAMLKLPQAKCQTFHHFKDGKYFREVRFPAGTFVIGHHQNFEHLNVFTQGRVSMLCEDGSFKELRAPMVFVGNPGRKVGYVHEDVVWYNVYVTDETDVQVLEKYYLADSEIFNRRPLEEAKFLAAMEARNDYVGLLTEKGLDQKEVKAIVESTADLVPMPEGSYKFQTGNSKIHGRGNFVTADLEAGECIGPASIKGCRTPLGRFTNHSGKPNAEFIFADDGDIYLHTLRKIEGQRGGLVGEEIVIDYRIPLKKIHGI